MTNQTPLTAQQRWEYLVRRGASYEINFEVLGNEGWELAAVIARGGTMENFAEFYFKRPRYGS